MSKYYNYQTPEGYIDSVDHELNLELFPGYTLLSETDEPQNSVEEFKIDYALLRRKSYPAIGDQLDAIWKGGDALIEMQKQIQAVKAAFPKPE